MMARSLWMRCLNGLRRDCSINTKPNEEHIGHRMDIYTDIHVIMPPEMGEDIVAVLWAIHKSKE